MARLIAERGDVIPLLAEVFRTYGFEGASLAKITDGTGLGKGSLYHFFPGGKEEMATAVLADIDEWFRVHVFAPLQNDADAVRGISHMFREVKRYFASGRRVCLVGVFALGNERDRFADPVKGYFSQWAAALKGALARTGRDALAAKAMAEDILSGIQGGLVLARALDDPRIFVRTLERLERSLELADT